MNLTVTPTWFNKTYQVLEGGLHTPIAIGDNIMVNMKGSVVFKIKFRVLG